MKISRVQSLAVRVYGFAMLCAVLVIVAHSFMMPRLTRASLHARFAHDVRLLADLVGMADDPAAAVERVAQMRGADVTLLGRDGAVVASAGAAIPPPPADTLARLAEAPAIDVGGNTTALRVGGPGRLAGSALLVRAAPPQMATQGTLAMALLMLAMIGVVSLWFARGLARPLARLAGAAERLGAGDLATRAGVERRDELGQVGAAFDQMAERIAALLDANQRLVANVSHELRTPLARIRVALELADESPGETREMLAGVGEDLAELEQLTDEILMMTRLAASGAPPLRLERCAPRELAERADRRWRQRHGERPLATEIADSPEISGDPLLLRRVIDNLLDNAAKYSPAERPVRLRVAQTGDQVRFEVLDEGRGLSAEELSHAFTPFWRADSSRARATGGVGLGLALARQIARAHGGDVALESEPGRGTRAVLSVPCAGPEAAAPQAK